MNSAMSPQSLIILMLGGLVIFFGRRSWILPTFLALTILVSISSHIMIWEMNFFPSRILLLFACARVLARGEYRELEFKPIDKALILLSAWMLITEILQRQIPGLIYGVSNYLYDGLGIYFLCRIFLREVSDLRRVIVALAWICCILAGFMLVEQVTRHNVLTWLGASSDSVQVRQGRMRCQATFLHPVLAGTFGAVLLPLFAAAWYQDWRMKRLAVVACIASTIITVTAGSGGPVMTYAAVVAGFCFWPLRQRMRLVRWGALLILLTLHLVMNAPVWALIGRLNVVAGASSYHRFELLDLFIRNVGAWWLIGVPSTGDWGWLTDDVANTYCIVAKHSGLLGVILFIRLLAAGFREVGIRRNETEHDWPTQILIWAFGISLFAHAVSYFGTSYFDQTRVLWSLTLAMLASLGLLTQGQQKPVVVESAQDAALEDGISGETPAGAH